MHTSANAGAEGEVTSRFVSFIRSEPPNSPVQSYVAVLYQIHLQILPSVSTFAVVAQKSAASKTKLSCAG